MELKNYRRSCHVRVVRSSRKHKFCALDTTPPLYATYSRDKGSKCIQRKLDEFIRSRERPHGLPLPSVNLRTSQNDRSKSTCLRCCPPSKQVKSQFCELRGLFWFLLLLRALKVVAVLVMESHPALEKLILSTI
jgi:hypothetical protein